MAVAQRGPMNVCPPFCQEVILELAFFFLELNMVWEVSVMLCMTELEFLKTIFLPLEMGKIGQA